MQRGGDVNKGLTAIRGQRKIRTYGDDLAGPSGKNRRARCFFIAEIFVNKR